MHSHVKVQLHTVTEPPKAILLFTVGEIGTAEELLSNENEFDMYDRKRSASRLKTVQTKC